MGLVSDSAVAPVIFERDTADVRKFLNRILGVQVLHQNLVLYHMSGYLMSESGSVL